MRSAVAIVMGGLLVAGCGGGSKHQPTSKPANGAPGSSTPAAPPASPPGAKCNFSVSLRAPGHHPVVNRNWTITVTVRPPTLVGKPYYQFLLNGGVVSTQYVNGNHNFTFRGRY